MNFFKRDRKMSSTSMGRKRALSGFKKGTVVAIKVRGLSARATVKKLKIFTGVIKNFLLLREDYLATKSPGCPPNLSKISKKSHYKKNQKWENNFSQTGNRCTDSNIKNYFVQINK